MFGKSTSEDLGKLDEKTFLEIFDGVPNTVINKRDFTKFKNIQDFLHSVGFLSSKSEILRSINQNAVSINKEKIDLSYTISEKSLICDKYILAQRGKKFYFMITID